jgi:hypothetical protein
VADRQLPCHMIVTQLPQGQAHPHHLSPPMVTGMAGLDLGRGRKVGERGDWGLASSESGVAVPDSVGKSF